MSEHITHPSSAALEMLGWSGPAIGLMDLDAFFASVEQLDHPEWRGRPLIVGGSASRRGVVSTASYEARVYGVHSAMPSAAAQRLCPEAIWTRGNFARYREVSDQVMDILVDETPRVEQVSIDEAFFDVTPAHFSHESPVAICKRIQERIAKLGVSASIGLGVNKTVAKIASERDKPRGMTVVLPGSEPAFLAPLDVGEMSGIGKATRSVLAGIGIHTLGELAACDERQMEKLFGVAGPRMVCRAAGKERSEVCTRVKKREVKSVSNERTFATDLKESRDVRAAIKHVAALTGTRLRRKGLCGTEVTLKLKFDATHTRTASAPLPSPTDDEHVFAQEALRLLESIWRQGTPIRLVGISISGFAGHSSHQLMLFDDKKDDQTLSSHDLRRLALATDEVKKRFGDYAIAY